jgi:hypothetical protein
MRLRPSEILQYQFGCLYGSLILKFHEWIHHLKRPNAKSKIILSALLLFTKVHTADLVYTCFSPLQDQSDPAGRYTDASAPADTFGVADSLSDPPSAKKGR